jgi:nitrogen fixation/metabolism regulation signal transduction histidine kinase
MEENMGSQRKKYLIDKKFQLRTTFSLIGFISVLFALLVLIAGINLLDVNDRIKNMIQINKAIADTISAPSPQISHDDYKNYILMQSSLDQNKKNLDNMINLNMTLILVIIGVVILQGIVLFYILIRQTHRIAGPIHVMTNYMRQIKEGKIPDNIRALRKNDFFKDTYEEFKEMIKYLKENNKK